MRRFSLLPLICFGVMFAYACYGAVVLGHWPYYAHPDPKELPVRVLLTVVGIVLLVGAVSLVLIPIGYGVWRGVMMLNQRRVDNHGVWIAVFIAGFLVWFLDLTAGSKNLPWHSVISWILD